MSSDHIKQKSILWYLLPILFSVIGGVIAYFVLRDDDPSKAKNCLWLGIILVIIYVAYYVVFTIMLEMFTFT
jgi:hypothetical protein